MRLIMMGNGPFAAPTLRALCGTPHEVAALVIRPARPVHGKAAHDVNPCQAEAAIHGTPTHAPEDVNAEESRRTLAEYRPDLFVVCDYGQILSRDTLSIARLGGINLHASLLPAYRGAAPINWAVYHGETVTGVTVIHITAQIDAGPAIGQAATPIGPDETAVELEPRLAALGAPLVCHCCDLVAAGEARPISQDSSKATRAPRLKKSDGLVIWTRSAAEIRNQVRAFEPWPKTCAYWHPASGTREPMRIILDRVTVQPADSPSDGAAGPGTIVAVEPAQLVVATGSGALGIERLQPAGKRVLSAAEFLNGYGPKVGDRFEAGPGE